MVNLSEIKALAKSFGISQLSRETGISRSHLYGIFDGKIDPQLSTYKKILDALNCKIIISGFEKIQEENKALLEDKDYLIWNLASYGAPLLADKKFDKRAEINNVLIEALIQGRKNAEINTVLPNFIYSNWERIRWTRIKQENRDKVYLSYLLNLIFQITNDFKVGKELDLTKIDKPKRSQLLIKNKISAFEKSMLKEVDNMVARSWKLLTADSYQGIEQRFNKWAN